MPNINQMRESNFLKKEDVGAGTLLTIKEVFQDNVAKQGAPEELKWCMSFNEAEKPVVLNSTNLQIAAKVFASENTDDWIGKKIVLYNDPNVSYAGKIIGGIRFRAPKNQPARASVPAQAPRQPVAPALDSMSPETDDDSVPF